MMTELTKHLLSIRYLSTAESLASLNEYYDQYTACSVWSINKRDISLQGKERGELIDPDKQHQIPHCFIVFILHNGTNNLFNENIPHIVTHSPRI